MGQRKRHVDDAVSRFRRQADFAGFYSEDTCLQGGSCPRLSVFCVPGRAPSPLASETKSPEVASSPAEPFSR